MRQLGIMQGRFTGKGGFYPQQFPWENWREEFELSRQAGLPCIEWMFNLENFRQNPIFTEEGRKEIKRLSDTCGVRVSSVCANYYMKKGLYRAPAELEIAKELVLRMEENQIGRLVIPLFEDNDPQTEEAYRLLGEAVAQLAQFAAGHGVKLGVEADWDIGKLCGFLQASALVGVCYDLGNAAGLGKDLVKELECLGGRLMDIHIKDKPLHGSTVMLGEGDVDLRRCLEVLDRLAYAGPYILESYYGKDAVGDTLKNIDYIRKQSI